MNKTRTLDLLNGIRYNSVFFNEELGFMHVIFIRCPDKFLCKMYKTDTFRIFTSKELKALERIK